MASAPPAHAQYADAISFDYFHDTLQQYGYWLYSDRWGLVWQPAQVPEYFRPYDTAGHWVYTDQFGWYWASDFPWGDITFHYGRWVNDPDDGWLWIPGYTWSPAWVAWRTNGQFVGWMPIPPDERFLSGEGDVSFGVSFGGAALSFSWNSDPYYGYRTWYGAQFDEQRFANNWVFVGVGHVADPEFRTYVVNDPVRVVNIIHATTNVTNYTVINNYVVNRGVSVNVVERAAGHPIRVEAARAVIRNPNLVVRVDTSRQIQERQRAFIVHGHGFANSAPPPPRDVVNRLSANVPARQGQQPTHLFTRATVSNPQVMQAHFRGAAAPGVERGGQMGPGETMRHHEAPSGGTPEGEMTHRPEQGQPGGGQGEMNGAPGRQPREMGRRPEQGPPNSGPPNEMNGPSGQQSGEMSRRPEQGAPSSGPPNEMSSPSGEQPREMSRRPEQGPPSGGPNEMNGPSGEQPREMSRRPEQGQPSGMNGPAGSPGNPPPETRHRPEQAPPGTNPGAMNGPSGANGPPHEMTRRPEEAPPSGSIEQGKPPPKKEKQQPPPPGTPPQ
jgi:hypothetical protein